LTLLPSTAAIVMMAISRYTLRPLACACGRADTAPATNSNESPGRKAMKTSPVSEKKIADSVT
jgi:hypothetical protein